MIEELAPSLGPLDLSSQPMVLVIKQLCIKSRTFLLLVGWSPKKGNIFLEKPRRKSLKDKLEEIVLKEKIWVYIHLLKALLDLESKFFSLEVLECKS
jgi:hypothetical protein